MYNDIIKSKLGLVVTIVVGTLASINATKVYEDILNKDISTPTILITEGVIILTAILLTVALIPKMTTKMMSDIKKMTIGDITRLSVYALIGIIFAFVANDVLVHHGTKEFNIHKVVLSLLIAGLMYFISNKKRTTKKIIFFIIFSIFAILFHIE